MRKHTKALLALHSLPAHEGWLSDISTAMNEKYPRRFRRPYDMGDAIACMRPLIARSLAEEIGGDNHQLTATGVAYAERKLGTVAVHA
jgi:hypothetical protein